MFVTQGFKQCQIELTSVSKHQGFKPCHTELTSVSKHQSEPTQTFQPTRFTATKAAEALHDMLDASSEDGSSSEEYKSPMVSIAYHYG